MAATENSKSLHVFHASHTVFSSKTTGAYHHNFGMHVNMCMIFCVLMDSCIINYTKCEDPTSIPSPRSGNTGDGARHCRHIHLYTVKVTNALVTCGTTSQHSHADFFTLSWKLEVVSQPVQGVHHWKCS